MAEYYKTDEVAKILGVAPADVNRMREKGELRGFRDGMDWKYRAADVDAQKSSGEATDDDLTLGESDIISDHDLGSSGGSSPGTVIGDEPNQPGESDLSLAGEGSADELGTTDDLDLTLEGEGVSLEDSGVGQKGQDGSSLDLSAEGEGLEDDDLVLSGSGSGSGLSIASDSAISLVDPADSGLSLEDPLELGGSEETLELGEDDMISLSEDADLDSPTELKAEDDFSLTPLDDAGDDDMESGSQVIALDEVEESDDVGMGMQPMLDEEFAGAGAPADMGGMDMGAGMPMQPGMGGAEYAPAGMAQQSAVALPEAPYQTWTIVMLVFCVIFLMMTGMMMADLVRHIWSWDQPYQFNSSIMDGIISMFEGE